MSGALPTARPLDPDEAIRPAVVVLPAVAFEPPLDELDPWLDRLPIADAVSIPGTDGPLYVTDRDGGVAVTTTGMGKPAAATTVAALFGASGLDLGSARFLSAGIAGAAPGRAALGSVFVADAILDWDRKHRWDPTELPAAEAGTGDGSGSLNPEPGAAVEPLAYLPEGSVRALDPDLVEVAVGAARDVDLVDRPAVRAYQERYPDAPDGGPGVGVGTTVASDEFWHGTRVAREVAALCAAYDVGPYATTQMEDAGTATALDRFDALDRYLSVRAVANYDRPAPGETVRESFDGTPESIAQAVENVARAGRAVVEALCETGR